MNNIAEFIARCEADCRPVFDRLEAVELENTGKVLSAFNKYEISQRHSRTTGYGYGDVGRDAIDRVYADFPLLGRAGQAPDRLRHPRAGALPAGTVAAG